MDEQTRASTPEPWLRGTLADLPAVPRAAIHALQLAQEDILRWASSLTQEQINERPSSVPSVSFHMRHIARSLDRLLTYAEGRQLSPEQFALLKTELEPDAERHAVFAELEKTLNHGEQRIRSLATLQLNEKRVVGRRRLPTTLAGLLVHVADHTQRHVGQLVTTAKIVLAGSKR